MSRVGNGFAISLLFILKLFQLFAKVFRFFLCKRPLLFEYCGLRAGAGDEDVRDAVQILTANDNLKRRALPAAGRIDITDTRHVLLCPRRRKDGQPSG